MGGARGVSTDTKFFLGHAKSVSALLRDAAYNVPVFKEERFVHYPKDKDFIRF